MQELLRTVTLNITDDTADLLDGYHENNWMTQVLRYHKQGENRNPEFVALAGVTGIIGNIIIGEVTTYGDISESAECILGRAQLCASLNNQQEPTNCQ